MNQKLIIISGPTASGKTSTAIDLAKNISAEIINFDSLLFYKELNIGTAKPSKIEMSEVPHHFVSNETIKNPINAFEFMKKAIIKINEILKKSHCILVGGSGFYLQALLKGMYDSPSTSKEILDKSQALYELAGINAFREILRENDFTSYEKYHENDHYRIRRAVEHFWSWGTKFSEARSKKNEENVNQENWPMKKYNWSIFHIHLDPSREEHDPIIKNRIEKMFSEGLLEEVESLLTKFDSNLRPLQSIGYKQVIEFINDPLVDLDQCKEKIFYATRHLAKAQRTWFKKVDKITYHPIKDKIKITKDLNNFINE